MRYWDRVRATVLTLNYDCLTELAYVQELGAAPEELYSIPVTPAALRVVSVMDGGARPSFRLLKLHGSLSWRYSGLGAAESDAVYDVSWTGRFGEGIRPQWPQLGDLVPDKVPLLIPPTATKAPYYSNRLIAAQWRHAAEALREADELVLMGFSAPETDLTVRTLVATNFRGEAIVPVDVSPELAEWVALLGDRRQPPEVSKEFLRPDQPVAAWTQHFASQ